MTGRAVGMTWEGAGMTGRAVGMTWEGAGMTGGRFPERGRLVQTDRSEPVRGHCVVAEWWLCYH